jgi:hypothetical protein
VPWSLRSINKYFCAVNAPESFPKFPYQDILGANSQDGRIAWRQSVKNQGKLIEDLGIKADIIVL